MPSRTTRSGRSPSAHGDFWPEEELLRIAAQLHADILLQGTVLDYNMERLHVGDPLLAGYKSFSGIAELELTAMRGPDLSTIGRLYSKKELPTAI